MWWIAAISMIWNVLSAEAKLSYDLPMALDSPTEGIFGEDGKLLYPTKSSFLVR